MNALTTRTQVAIIGAGPAGLTLSHLLAARGIDSVVVETRGREAIESTIRAGVLEQGTVDLLTGTGVDTRVLTEGVRHDGVEFRFGGRGHRIDFAGLVGRSVWLYPQHEVLKDLIATRLARGADIRFGVSDVVPSGVETDSPAVHFTDAEGRRVQLRCDVVAGCDGSAGVSRAALPEDRRVDHFRTYPFGWFGILAEAPPSSPELVYAHSDRGFALISTRTPEVQRMYFQCAPDEDASTWSDARIWDELQARVAGDGFALKEGSIFQRGVIPMRSYVCDPMRFGRLLLAGDAAHTVPPTGAKGLNLAVADVIVMARVLGEFLASGEERHLDSYGPTALRRVWRAQHFSWWMTSMLHTPPEATPFDVQRQLGELDMVTSSRAGAAYLAEAYTGWPIDD
ncbi:p-hydroxybenzoate 3-monooxygenase [Nocardiopsis sp. Huas11]|uniref:4-hydroxybenzoate 3-monooxygenase n=1 Tax=Nocardiopsis sp. Huas11 TaxID=2183912 RepID=UPI000EAC9F9F|nr:4-hydroxybenzoate 3-monooxygenase [Nocardiopsis sp. Huas11]RKS09190.1 p-hydroxybenzoate 3-monooxygenase [Nocardiopsis sp. Huas11]